MSLIGVSQDFKIRNREIKYLSLHSGSFLKNLRNLKYKNPKYKELSVVNGGFFFFFFEHQFTFSANTRATNFFKKIMS